MQKRENTARMLYLIRHCNIDSRKRYISSTDLPLDAFGEYQASRLKCWAADKPLTAVYASPLIRARATAEVFGLPVIIRNELREADVGEWEGRTLSEIKDMFPADFKKHGEYPGTAAPTGGESLVDAGLRLLKCLREIVFETHGDIAVVSHGTACHGALSMLLGQNPDEAEEIPHPRGSISAIEVSPDGDMTVRSVGIMPDLYPDERSVLWLRDRYGMAEHVSAHCDAVANTAARLASEVTLPVDSELLCSAARLHDISRERGFTHAEDGAKLVLESGYPAVSEIIAHHHDLPVYASIEARLLFLADKLVLEDREVSLFERFEASKKKCKTPDALDAWKRRFDAAKAAARALGLEEYISG